LHGNRPWAIPPLWGGEPITACFVRAVELPSGLSPRSLVQVNANGAKFPVASSRPLFRMLRTVHGSGRPSGGGVALPAAAGSSVQLPWFVRSRPDRDGGCDDRLLCVQDEEIHIHLCAQDEESRMKPCAQEEGTQTWSQPRTRSTERTSWTV